MKLRNIVEIFGVVFLILLISVSSTFGTITISDVSIIDSTQGTMVNFTDNWAYFNNISITDNIATSNVTITTNVTVGNVTIIGNLSVGDNITTKAYFGDGGNLTNVSGSTAWCNDTFSHNDTFIKNSNGNYWNLTFSGLQNAIWDLNSTTGTVWLPQGQITMTDRITISKTTYLRIEGVSREGTILHAANSNGAFYFKADKDAWFELANLQITGTGYDANLVEIDGGYMVYIDNCWIHNAGYNSGGNSKSYGIYAVESQIFTLKDSYVSLCNNTGVYLDRNETSLGVMVATIDNCHIQDNEGDGIYHERAVQLRVINSEIEANEGYGIYLNDTWNDVIQNCYFEMNNLGHIAIEANSGNELRSTVISNCYFEGEGVGGLTDCGIKVIKTTDNNLTNTIVENSYFRDGLTPFDIDGIDFNGFTIRNCEFEDVPLLLTGVSGITLDSLSFDYGSFNDECIELIYCDNINIRNLQIDGNDGTNTILLTGTNNSIISNCILKNIDNTAMKLNLGSKNNIIQNVVIDGCNVYGMYFESAGINNKIIGCVINNTIAVPITISGTGNLTIMGCSITNADDDYAITLNNCDNVSIIGNYFEGNEYYEVYFAGSTKDILMIGNIMKDSIPLINDIDSGIAIINNNMGYNYDSLQNNYIWNSNGKYWNAKSANIQLAINDVNSSTNGTVWLPAGSEFTTTSTIQVWENITFDCQGSTIRPNGDFDIFKVHWYSTVKNVVTDSSNVANYGNTTAHFNISTDYFGGAGAVEGFDYVRNVMIENVNMIGANQRGIGIYIHPLANGEDLAGFTFNDIRGKLLNATIKILVDTAGTYVNFCTWNNIFGDSCAYFIWFLETTVHEISGHVFNNIRYEAEPVGNEHYPIFFEGNCNWNVLNNIMIMDWVAEGDTTDYIYLKGADGGHNIFIGSTVDDDYITDENTNKINSFYGSYKLHISEINISHINRDWAALTGLKIFASTEGNPYLYIYGDESGTPRYGATRIDSVGNWDFITQVGDFEFTPVGEDFKINANVSVVGNISATGMLSLDVQTREPSFPEEGQIYANATDNNLWYNNSLMQVDLSLETFSQNMWPDISDNSSAFWYNSTGEWMYLVKDFGGVQYYLNMSTTY